MSRKTRRKIERRPKRKRKGRRSWFDRPLTTREQRTAFLVELCWIPLFLIFFFEFVLYAISFCIDYHVQIKAFFTKLFGG
jgi:hypothetical protein